MEDKLDEKYGEVTGEIKTPSLDASTIHRSINSTEKAVVDWALTMLELTKELVSSSTNDPIAQNIFTGLGVLTNYAGHAIDRSFYPEPSADALQQAWRDTASDVIVGKILPWQVRILAKLFGDMTRSYTSEVEGNQVSMRYNSLHQIAAQDPTGRSFIDFHEEMDRGVLWESYGLSKGTQFLGNFGQELRDGMGYLNNESNSPRHPELSEGSPCISRY